MWTLQPALGPATLRRVAPATAACSLTRAFGVEQRIRRLRLRGHLAEAFRRSRPPRLQRGTLEQYLRALKARGTSDEGPSVQGEPRGVNTLAPEERARLLAHYLPDDRETVEQLRKNSHKWLWRWTRRRDWSRWDVCVDKLRAHQLPFDEITYNLLIFGMFLHPRHEDEAARRLFTEMMESGKFHPALLRILGGFVNSYFELKELGATPNRENLTKALKTFWQISLNFKRARIKGLRQRLVDAVIEQRQLSATSLPPEVADLEQSLQEGMSDEENIPRVRFPARRPHQLKGVHKGSGAPRRRNHRWKH